MSIAPRASASAACRRRGLARRAGPRAPGAGRPRGRHVVGSRPRRHPAVGASGHADPRPALALIGWAHFAPPINDSFRKSYRLLLRWNDETPFVKFAVGEDERPVLIAEIPVGEPRRGRAGPRGRPPARGRRPLPRARDDLAQGRRLVDRGAARTATDPGRRLLARYADRARRAAGAGGRVGVTATAATATARELALRASARPSRRRPRCSRSRWPGSRPSSGPLPASPAAAANTDLTLVTNATYTVQPTHGRVHVVVAIDARNHRGETRTHKYYFDHAFLAVQPGASGFAISGRQGRDRAGRRSGRRTRRCCGSTSARGCTAASGRYARAHLQPRRSRQAGRTARSGSGPGLVTFPVWAFASDGAKGSRVQVHFPAGYDVSVESGDFDSRTKGTDGGVTLSTQPLGEPLDVLRLPHGPARGGLQGDAAARSTRASADVDLVVRGWRDDPAWAGRIGGLFRKALPQLTREIGLPWPETPADRGPGGGEPGGRRLRRAVRPGRAADRGRLLGRPAGRPPRGRARLVQRRRWSPTAGPARGSRRCTRSARPGKLKVRDTSPKLTAAVARPRSRSTPGRTPPATSGGADLAHGDVRLRGLPRARPRDRRSGPGTTPSSASGRRRARASAPTSPRRPARSATTPAIPRRSTARPTGAACSTCSRPRPARTSPTCGASG